VFEGFTGLSIVNADGSHPTVLTLRIKSSEPDWSPDGEQIAFTGDDAIYVVNIDGNGLKRITKPPGRRHRFQRPLVPGRKTLLFIREGTLVHGAFSDRMYASRSAGGNLKLLLSTRPSTMKLTSASWSPDGMRIAYAAGGTIHFFDLARQHSRIVGLKPCSGAGSCSNLDWQRMAPRR
jgi:Tol biopolymer transport system component